MSVPFEALTLVKCNACNKYLSYFPIYINLGTQLPICGRCSEHLPIRENYVRNTAFESMTQFLKFPCIYDSEGCVEHMTPLDVPNHEKTCSYRIISCALDCVWQGTLHELSDHVEETHPNAILRNGEFEVDVLSTYEVYSFVFHEDEIFTIKRKYNSSDKTLRCSLSSYKTLEPLTKYFYEITIFNGPKSLSVKFPLKSADCFEEANVTSISIDNLKLTLNDPSIIIGFVKIFTAIDQTREPREVNPDIRLDLLSELECPVCFDYIIPPIYQCIAGHSICGDCKIDLHQCPTCRGKIETTQNFVLEKMSSLLTYPCKYSEAGCDFVSKPVRMKQHQKYCLFGPHPCPLKDYENCEWFNVAKEIYPHVTSQHHDNILDLDTVFVFIENNYFETEDNQCYIKKFSDALFKLHYRYIDEEFYWSMQLIGPPEEARNYKFELDILDATNSNQKMFFRTFCAPLKEKNQTFEEAGSYICLDLDMIRPFITDQLNFTVRITK